MLLQYPTSCTIMGSEFIHASPIAPTDGYYNLGSFGRKISTNSTAAQIWFNRALAWTYSFNHEEAENCFQQVIAHDPNCAMGYWGVGFTAGPNYNRPWATFDESDMKHSVRKGYHVARAAEKQSNLASATLLEKALVKALQHRFPTDKIVQDFDAVNNAYADAMRTVYQDFGQEDLDITAIFADALMNTAPWGLYNDRTGEPAPNTPVQEVKDVLERGLTLPAAQSHPGILHLYIHLMELSATPEAALVPADQLRDLVPDGGHLRHMPSHLDVLVGDYRRSIDGNMKATLADDKFYARNGGKNFYSFYRLHNFHSLIYAAMMTGQSGLALESTTRMEATLTEDMLKVKSPPLADWLEFFNSVRVHVLVRFGLWDELIDLPVPENRDLYCATIAMVHYGKAIAYAATATATSSSSLHEADRERERFRAAAARVPASRMDFRNRVVDELKLVTAMLDGEIEYRRGNYEVAYERLAAAVREEDNLVYSEPGWVLPSRHAYAALLLEQGHVVDAAEVYADDLGLSGRVGSRRHPNNVWALHGYHECLVRLGRMAEARVIGFPLKVAMGVADIPIRSSCYCRLGTAEGNAKGRRC